MKRYSIKTVDGHRHDLPEGVEYYVLQMHGTTWLTFEAPGRQEYINLMHVVSITEESET